MIKRVELLSLVLVNEIPFTSPELSAQRVRRDSIAASKFIMITYVDSNRPPNLWKDSMTHKLFKT